MVRYGGDQLLAINQFSSKGEHDLVFRMKRVGE